MAARAECAEREPIQGRLESAHDSGAESATLLIRPHRDGFHVACFDLCFVYQESTWDDARVGEQGAFVFVQKQGARSAESVSSVLVGKVAREGGFEQISQFGAKRGLECLA